jgi:formyltetrahydrofolate synthetase
MNDELIKELEDKTNRITINEEDPFVKESCKNIYKALLVVCRYENPPINDINNLLSDTDKTISLLKKFKSINNDKYNGNLSYIFVDTNNYDNLNHLIGLLNNSVNNDEINKNVSLKDINTILDDIISTCNLIKIERIASIKFLSCNCGYTVELKNSENKCFYIGISEYGYVEIVREDSLSGKVIYMPLDD